VEEGEVFGFLGPNGAGKTTTIRVLMALLRADSGTARIAGLDCWEQSVQIKRLVGYLPGEPSLDPNLTGGQILIDGQNISDVTQQSLRQAISYVPQEPLLFHRTVRDNIAYGKPDATKAEIVDAARKAYADDFITALPDSYDTIVGERGVKLSGGQRQRVAIARAILKDAPILVLDEATSALDSESEKVIQSALTELMKHKTTIVIAHRLSTIQRLDSIVVLDDGKIVESGTHTSLITRKDGLYARLWAHQSGGFIDD
jgi:ABC-type multidrug transport system fused ATPase/permease subunit